MRVFFPASAGDPLLEYLHHQGWRSVPGLSDEQMEVFWHDDIAGDGEVVLRSNFFQDLEKEIATLC